MAVFDKTEPLNPTAAHHTITTARRPDHTRSSALVRSQSIRSMAGSGCWPQRRLPEMGLRFAIFARFILQDTLQHTATHTATHAATHAAAQHTATPHRNEGDVAYIYIHTFINLYIYTHVFT